MRASLNFKRRLVGFEVFARRRLFTLSEEDDNTGIFAVQKALEKHLRESDGSTGYENGRCGRIPTAPGGYARRAVGCVSNGLEIQRRVEKRIFWNFNGHRNLYRVLEHFFRPFEICYVFFFWLAAYKLL